MTRHPTLARNLMPLAASLRQVMTRLNEGVGGVVLVTDDTGVLQGVVTDGDVRRAIIAGAAFDTPADAFMSRRFTAGRDGAEPTANLALLSARVRHLPILDAEGRPVDLLTWADLWKMPLVQPSLGGNEAKYVNDCLATGWISSQGTYIERFQSAFAAYHGAPGVACEALCCSSGTTALHLALAALGIGPGDEVIVPDFTFGATANVVIHAGATPVFVDVDPATWTMSPAAAAAAVTERTKAIIPVHLYGHPCDMDPLLALAKEHKLKVVEDCAEALGAEYKGRKVGTIGDVGCFSFFANKIITTGEGGMVITADKELAAVMARLRDHGMAKDRRYWHLEAGFNYRMTNLQAALGLAQMEVVDTFLARRAELVARYDRTVAKIQGLSLPPRAPWARNVHWLYTVTVDEAVLGLTRDTLAEKLKERGIETRPVFFPLHPQPAYRTAVAHPCPVTEDLAARGLSLPTGNDMTVEDAGKVCEALTSALHTHLVTLMRSA